MKLNKTLDNIKLLILAGLILTSASLKSGTPQQKNEAEEYYKEARRLSKSDKKAAWKKLNAALALDPENRKIIALKLDWQYSALKRNDPLDKYKELLKKMLANDLARKCYLPGIARKMFWDHLEKAWLSSSKAERKRFALFLAEFRKHYFAWFKQTRGWKIPPKSKKDFDFYTKGIRMIYIYFDDAVLKRELLDNIIEFLKESDRFIRENPKTKFDSTPGNWVLSGIDKKLLTGRKYDINNQKWVKYTPEELGGFFKAASVHISPEVRLFGKYIEFYSKVTSSGFNKKIFRTEAEKLYPVLAERPPESQKIYKKYLQGKWLLKHPELVKIHNELSAKYAPLLRLDEARLFVEKIRSIKDPNQVPRFLLDNKEKCLLYAEALRKVPLGGNWVGHLANQLQYLIWKKNPPMGREALKIFNYRMDIKQVWKAPKIHSRNFWCYDGIVSGNELLLTATDNQTAIRIDALDLKTEKVRNLYHYKTASPHVCYTYRNLYSNSFALDVNDEYLLAGGFDALYIFKLDGTGVKRLTDLPEARTSAVVLLDKRIYVWAGEKPNHPGFMLYSCDFNGNNRKLLFHAKRKDNPVKFHPYGRVRGIFADRIHSRLLILLHDRLCELNPKNNKVKELVNFHRIGAAWNNNDQTVARLSDDRKQLIISVRQDCLIYDMKKQTCKFLYSTRQNAKAKRIVTGITGGPYCQQGNYLWMLSHGHGVRCMDLSKESPKEIFFYPEFEEKSRSAISRIFPCPNNKSVLLIRGSDVLKLTPENKEMEEE